MKLQSLLVLGSLALITSTGFSQDSKPEGSSVNSKQRASKKQPEAPPKKVKSPNQQPPNQQAGQSEDNLNKTSDMEKRREADNEGWNNPLENPVNLGTSDSRGGFSPSRSP